MENYRVDAPLQDLLLCLASRHDSHGLECWPFHYIDYITRRGGQLSISMWLPDTCIGQHCDANHFTFDGAIENRCFGTDR